MNRRPGRAGTIGLCLLGLALLLPGTRTLPLLDRDEPRFAQATREMRDRGDWIVPTFNNEYRFDKPPLTYWLMAPGIRWLGDHELGARIHSVVSTVLLALLVFRFALALGLGRPAGWGAAAAMMASVQFLVHGRSAVADLPMVLCVTAVQYAAYRLLCQPRNPGADRRLRGLLCVALAGGFLAKGPIAWGVPFLSLLLFRRLFRRRPLPWRRLGLSWVLPAALGLVALWGLPALWRTQGEFWNEGIGFHVVERGMRRFHGRLFVPLYYPLTALVSLFPWSLHLGRVVRTLRTRTSADAPAFLLAWFLSPMLLFLPYATQLPHYAMPGFPAFFLLLALSWTPATGRGGRILPNLFLGLGTAVGLLPVAVLPWLPSEPGLRLAAGGAALLVLTLTWLPVWTPRAAPARMSLAVVVLAIGMQGLALGVRRVHVVTRLATAFAEIPANARCLMWRYREPSVVYYSGRIWTESVGLADVQAAVRGDRPVCILALDREVRLSSLIVVWAQRLAGREAPIPWRADHAAEVRRAAGDRPPRYVEGFSPARGVWVRLAWICTPAPAAEPDGTNFDGPETAWGVE